MQKQQQRPRPTLANGGQAQIHQQPKRGFAGFKASPKTDLIDAILMQEDETPPALKSKYPQSRSPKEQRATSPYLNRIKSEAIDR